MNARETTNLSRRAVLRGIGATVALPLLQSLPADGGVEEVAGHPKRLAVVFLGNGIHPKHFWAKGSGAEMQLGDCLASLAPFREKLNYVNGLFNQRATGVGIHPPQTGGLLTGMRCKPGPQLGNGVSFDQVLARRAGRKAAVPSLVLGCEQPVTGFHETNCSMAYSSHISWASDTAPVPLELYPALAWDALFDNRGSRRTASILDRVLADAKSINADLDVGDRHKLDEFLTSTRELEVRIERARAAHEEALERTGKTPAELAGLPRPEAGLPEEMPEYHRLMCDLIAVAFQTGRTRIATLMLNRDLSGLIYPFLGVRSAHHPNSHQYKKDPYRKITTYMMERYAYLLERLDAMEEGDGTVLDHSLVLFVSNMWTGNHDNKKVPVITAGGLDGAVETGRVLDYQEAGDENRRLCSLYLGLMDRMGVELDSFGDADTRLEGF